MTKEEIKHIAELILSHVGDEEFYVSRTEEKLAEAVLDLYNKVEILEKALKERYL